VLNFVPTGEEGSEGNLCVGNGRRASVFLWGRIRTGTDVWTGFCKSSREGMRARSTTGLVDLAANH
jgi:hypothetical protein